MKYVIKYVHTKFEGCLNSFEIRNFIYVIILQRKIQVNLCYQCHNPLVNLVYRGALIPLLKTRPSTQTTILGISVKFYYLSKSKKNKLKMFNMISKPHKKNMAFKSRLRLNISSCIAAFWSSPPFVRANSCDFELIVPGWEDWNLKKGIFFINID